MPIDQLSTTVESLPGKITCIRLSGNLDAHTFEVLQDLLTDNFEKGCFKIILDVSEVPYMSSAGAGVLIGGLTEAENKGGKLIVLGMRAEVKNVFATLGILDFFATVDDRASAIAAF